MDAKYSPSGFFSKQISHPALGGFTEQNSAIENSQYDKPMGSHSLTNKLIPQFFKISPLR